MKLFRAEPVAITGSILAAFHAVIAALLVFGVIHFTAEQVAQAEAGLVAVLGIPATLFLRSTVSPVAAPAAPPAAAPVITTGTGAGAPAEAPAPGVVPPAA